MAKTGLSIAVTGANGLLGSILAEDLGRDHRVTGLDRDRFGRGDLRHLRTTVAAFRGHDVVIDLAARLELDRWRPAYRNNIAVTRTVLDSARRAGVKRVIYASSNHVVGLYEQDEPYASIVSGRLGGITPAMVPPLGVDVPVRPDGAYAVAKVAGEALGRYYSDVQGLSVLCLRIGTVNRADQPGSAREFATLLTQRDLVGLVRACIAAPDALRFGVFYGVSANTWNFWDLAPGRQALDWSPVDDAERWR